MKLTRGQRIDGNIEILREIGQGAFASVYEAYHEPLARRVAVKVLDPMELNPEARARFQLEAKLSTQLNSLHLVRVFSFGELTDGTPFFVMEFVEGETLAAVLQRQGKLEWRAACELMIQVLDGLKQAHSMGILHRDLKPGNILLTLESPPTAKLSDFGLAKFKAQNQVITRVGEVCGTPQYMSPEQIYGDALDAGTDIYSMGCIFYEALSGCVAFDGVDYVSIAHQHFEHQLEPIAGVPSSLNQIIANATAKLPAHRYKDAEIFAEDLRQALSSGYISCSMPARARIARAAANWPFLSAVATAVCMCAVIGFVAFLGFHTAQEQALRATLDRCRLASDTEVVSTLSPMLAASKNISRSLYLDTAALLAGSCLRTARLTEARNIAEQALRVCSPSDSDYETLVDSQTESMKLANDNAEARLTLEHDLDLILGKKPFNMTTTRLCERLARLLDDSGRRDEGSAFLRRVMPYAKGKARMELLDIYATSWAFQHGEFSADEMLKGIATDLNIDLASSDGTWVLRGVLAYLADQMREEELFRLYPRLAISNDSVDVIDAINIPVQYLLKMGRWSEAREKMLPYLTSKHRQIRSVANDRWGYYLMSYGRYDELQTLSNSILAENPAAGPPWVWRAVVANNSGNKTLAVECCKHAFQNSNEVYRFALGELPYDIIEKANAELAASSRRPKMQ